MMHLLAKSMNMLRPLYFGIVITLFVSCADNRVIPSGRDSALINTRDDTSMTKNASVSKISFLDMSYGGIWPSVCGNPMLDAKFDSCRESEESWGVKIKDECWEALDDDAKLYYCLKVRESFYQNCSFLSYDSAAHRKIPFRLPARMDGFCTSWRQTEFLKEHRDAAITSLKECLEQECTVDIETKRTIEDLAAVELIPDLVQCYRTTEVRDLTILTLFIRFMEMSGYGPIYNAGFYVAAVEEQQALNLLSSDVSEDVDILRNGSILYTTKVEREIIQLAESFYTELYGEH